MNARAYQLTVTLHAVLATLPGATAISIHASTMPHDRPASPSSRCAKSA